MLGYINPLSVKQTKYKGIYSMPNGRFAAMFYYGNGEKYLCGNDYQLIKQAMFFLQWEIIQFDRDNPDIETWLEPRTDPLQEEEAEARLKAKATIGGRQMIDAWKVKQQAKKKKKHKK